MALPPSVTALNLSGTWVAVRTSHFLPNTDGGPHPNTLNKTLGDDTNEILRLQGVDSPRREAMATITVNLCARHYKDDNNVEHVCIESKIPAGIPGSQSKSRRVRLKERHD